MSLSENTDLYQSRVDEVMRDWLENKHTQDRLERLAFMLGLRYLAYTNGYRVVPAHAMVPQREQIVINALMTLLHRHDPTCLLAEDGESVILGGLLHRDRWRECFEAEDRAYAFAILAARFFDRGDKKLDRGGSTDMSAAKANMFEALNQDIAYELGMASGSLPTAKLRAKYFFAKLFGEAWSELMITGEQGGSLATLIQGTSPPFLPGLLPAQVQQVSVDLPQIEDGF
jgi:hypothetical protein